MAQKAFYLNINTPVYVSIQSREAFADSVVQEGHVLLFSQDGQTLTGKLHDGSFITVGSDSFDFSETTAVAQDVLATKKFYNASGVLTTGTIPTVTAVLEGNKVLIPKGYIAQSDSITVPSGTDLQAGVLVEDGGVLKVQPLSFDGTVASDSGSLQTFTMKIFNTGHEEPAYPQGGGGSTDFYKCTAVFAPQAGENYVTVSGCGEEGANGVYYATSDISQGEPVYTNNTSPQMPWHVVKLNVTDAHGWAIIQSYNAQIWNDQYDILFAQNSLGQWEMVLSDLQPPSSVVWTTTQSNSSQTWNGKKAYLGGGVYKFESDSTSGLEWSSVKPIVGSVYSEDALMKVQVFQGIPLQGLVLYHPLEQNLSTLATGQSITTIGTPVFETLNGVPCCTFNGSSYFKTEDTQALPIGSNARSFSFWMKVAALQSSDDYGYMGYGSGSSGKWFLALSNNSGLCLTIYGTDNFLSASDTPLNQWNHIAVTLGSGTLKIFVNGTQKKSSSISANTASGSLFTIGAGSYSSSRIQKFLSGSMAAVRVYNRALSTDEINLLANQFTPTT